jgi:Asp-tRNA(Asn)/Glu-tRNA(Gln) amidotransferase B subunit
LAIFWSYRSRGRRRNSVGQAMKATGGKADPKVVNELLKAKLGL